jgi:hypothetical protein
MATHRGFSAAPHEKTALARAALAAIEPLVELLLELGITSPEAESLLRSMLVHAARRSLKRQDPRAAPPSDVRVSLATGVHRNFVRRILSEPPRIAAARERKGHRASRLLEAWHSDPAFLDSSGKPRDLSEKDQEPSFHTLAATYMPGTAPGVVLGELRRAGLVQMLAEHRVRARGRSFRPLGISAGSVADMGRRARALLGTLTHNLREPQSPLLCESMPDIEIDASRAAFVRDLIARRSANFLDAVREELAAEARGSRRRRSAERVKIGLTMIATER